MTRTVPVPLQVEERKTHPSCERAKANGVPDGEAGEASSSSETRLFNFFSPEKETAASAAPARPATSSAIKANGVAQRRTRESRRRNTNPERTVDFTHRVMTMPRVSVSLRSCMVSVHDDGGPPALRSLADQPGLTRRIAHLRAAPPETGTRKL